LLENAPTDRDEIAPQFVDVPGKNAVKASLANYLTETGVDS